MPFFKLSGRLLHNARTKYEKRFLPTSFLTPGMYKMLPSTMGMHFFRRINVRVCGCPTHYIFHYYVKYLMELTTLKPFGEALFV